MGELQGPRSRDVLSRSFPRRQIRDALGLVRLLWLAEHERGSVDFDGDHRREIALLAIGRDLAEVLLWGPLQPGSARCEAARKKAGRAMDRLVDLGWEEEHRFMVSAARDRVREPERPPDERELKRQARLRRG